MPSFRLSPGQALLGNGQSIRFGAGEDGVRITADAGVEPFELYGRIESPEIAGGLAAMGEGLRTI
jgi:hypothetical protein